MAWPTDPRPAKALMVLRRQINALAPNRSVSNEGALLFGGMLGDDAHQARVSDHNPDDDGVVKATDITKDLQHGINTRKLAQAILDSKDDRVAYVISNGQIASGSGLSFPQGVWRDRNKGAGDHTEHMHLSLKKDAKFYDDERAWMLPGFTAKPDANAPPQLDKPLLKKGMQGDAVRELQRLLFVDGNFGPTTEAAVKAFQTENGLVPDGVVGVYTWRALLQTGAVVDTDIIDTAAIAKLAGNSALAKVRWNDRGQAPIGYIKGMAVMYALISQELAKGNPVAVEMAKANTGDDAHDALSWYNSNFAAKGWSNAVSGQDTLRNLFVLMIGLGMRESAGRYCEGRDKSASNTTADTAEAGLFQMSWDANSCSALLPQLLTLYQVTNDSTLALFKEGVTPKSGDFDNYGAGTGATYQKTAKSSPAFAVESTGVGLRNLRKHWGPINRKEVELRSEAYELLKQIDVAIRPAVVVGKGQATATKTAAAAPSSPRTTTVAAPATGGLKMNDTLVSVIRYCLIGGGLFVAGRYGIPAEAVTTAVDQVMPNIDTIVTAGGSLFAAAGVVWGVIVNMRTKRVPVDEALRPDVQTASPVTGAPEPASKFTIATL